MEVGTLVICINDRFPPNAGINGEKLPKKDIVYTIREVVRIPEIGMALRLEEIRNPEVYYILPSGASITFECAFTISRFREIESEFDLNTLLEEIFDTSDNLV